ncbi:SwmB domain-containing protein [Verminephrobacter aporrectodeae]|uniref:SwmB domain-containing protein n=1 Tax=Verminephrobacter aporrectodeae TaxID=1110389 RepID=UPI002237ABDB|nr:SwmB domain-containing protein [Verminephrobacter aporrectodeae]
MQVRSVVSGRGKTVTLTLSRAVAGGETLKLSYTKPTTGDNVIQDATGNDAASFTDRAVSNLARTPRPRCWVAPRSTADCWC